MISSDSATAKLTKTGIPIRNLWHMLLYVWNAVHFQSRWKSESENAPTLDALLASILANLIQQRLRIGLGRDYRSNSSEVAGVRGRVDFDQSLKRMTFQQGRAFCHFQVFSANVPKNQIVRSTLARLVQVGEFGGKTSDASSLRSHLRRIVLDMEPIQIFELQATDIRREQLKRHDSDYRLMLAICHLLNQRQMPTEDSGNVSLPSLDRDAFVLYNIFEQFVAKFYAHHLKDWQVLPQQKLVWPAEESSSYLPAMYPDLTLQHKDSGQLVILDTKFTAKSLVTGRWDNESFNRDHLYQIYAYLRSQEHRSEYHRKSKGVLLYPVAGKELSEQVLIQGHPLHWETVDLASSWENIETQLLALPINLIDGTTN